MIVCTLENVLNYSGFGLDVGIQTSVWTLTKDGRELLKGFHGASDGQLPYVIAAEMNGRIRPGYTLIDLPF